MYKKTISITAYILFCVLIIMVAITENVGSSAASSDSTTRLLSWLTIGVGVISIVANVLAILQDRKGWGYRVIILSLSIICIAYVWIAQSFIGAFTF